jgi:hypothetical protein
MSNHSKRLPDDNEKLQPLVGENCWSKNMIIMAGSKDNLELELYIAYQGLPKVQPLVAQIGWTHNPIVLQCCQELLECDFKDLNAEAATLAATLKKNFGEVGI